MNEPTRTAGPVIRPLRASDIEAIRRIYAQVVTDTHVSFEFEPPSTRQIRARVDRGRLPWLVAELDGVVAGYACATVFRPRPAYDWLAEVSFYVAEEQRRQGVGGRLLTALLARLTEAGYRAAMAVVASPNEASAVLLSRHGFRKLGTIRAAGFKFGQWWDVELWQAELHPVAWRPRGRPVPR